MDQVKAFQAHYASVCDPVAEFTLGRGQRYGRRRLKTEIASKDAGWRFRSVPALPLPTRNRPYLLIPPRLRRCAHHLQYKLGRDLRDRKRCEHPLARWMFETRVVGCPHAPPVDKRHLSTGENGETGGENRPARPEEGVRPGAPALSAQTGERLRPSRGREMLRIAARDRMTGAVNKQGAARSSKKKRDWLPGMDSNHDSRLQRPLSYH